jgi:uncharacterized protein (UPF0147 family)
VATAVLALVMREAAVTQNVRSVATLQVADILQPSEGRFGAVRATIALSVPVIPTVVRNASWQNCAQKGKYNNSTLGPLSISWTRVP